jgi:hypothetical protein
VWIYSDKGRVADACINGIQEEPFMNAWKDGVWLESDTSDGLMVWAGIILFGSSYSKGRPGKANEGVWAGQCLLHEVEVHPRRRL